MTVGSVKSTDAREPVLVLGLGNPLLADDGAGLKLLEAVEDRCGPGVEYVDGGTQGLALLGYLGGRRLTVILDAVGLGAAPGAVHLLTGSDIEKFGAHRAASAHEGNALELLSAARLLGDDPGELLIVGLEPAEVRTGVGLTAPVAAAVPQAAALAIEQIRLRLPSGEGTCVSRSLASF